MEIVREVLNNARDHVFRRANCNRIDVALDEEGYITVTNNGDGIPAEQVDIRPDVGSTVVTVWKAEAAFGVFGGSSNYNDEEIRLTGGRFGQGVTVANALSLDFEVSSFDNIRGIVYSQRWQDNMRTVHPAQITKRKPAKNGKTTVRFLPDLAALGVPEAWRATFMRHPVVVGALRTMVWETAATMAASIRRSTTVTFNGVKNAIQTMPQLAKLFLGDQSDTRALIHDKFIQQEAEDDFVRLTYVLAPLSDEVGGGDKSNWVASLPRVVGYANSIRIDVGTHVESVLSPLVEQLREAASGEHPDGVKVKKADQPVLTAVTATKLQKHCFLLVNAVVNNVQFDSAAKKRLVNSLAPSSKSFIGYQYSPSTRILQRVLRSEMIAQVVRKVKLKEALLANSKVSRRMKESVTRVQGRVTVSGIKGLYDAHYAGMGEKHACRLWMVEGNSAGQFVMSGLQSLEHDGVFILTGKLQNLDKVSNDAHLLKNKIVQDVCTALGITYGTDYTDAKARRGVRYRHLMKASDQDADGQHIWALIMVLVCRIAPTLLKAWPDFFGGVLTPLLTVSSKSAAAREAVAAGHVARLCTKEGDFFSTVDYEAWVTQERPPLHQCEVQYIKGLGVMNQQMARKYMTEPQYRCVFTCKDDQDLQLLNIWMSDGKADVEYRKDQLRHSSAASDGEERGSIPYVQLQAEGRFPLPIPIRLFCDTELANFSRDNLVRSMPLLVDGLKSSERRVLFTLLDRGAEVEKLMRVSQAKGAVTEKTRHPHGEAALPLPAMGADFPGANTMTVFKTNGQYGSKLSKDSAAQDRYLEIAVNAKLAYSLYPKDDLKIVPRSVTEGALCEPEYMCPVVPMLLINETNGIGTGWNNQFLPLDPFQVVQTCKKLAAYLVENDSLDDTGDEEDESAACIPDDDDNNTECQGADATSSQQSVVHDRRDVFLRTLAEEVNALPYMIDMWGGVHLEKGKTVFFFPTYTVQDELASGDGFVHVHITELPPRVYVDTLKERLEDKDKGFGTDLVHFRLNHCDATVDIEVVLHPTERVKNWFSQSEEIRSPDGKKATTVHPQLLKDWRLVSRVNAHQRNALMLDGSVRSFESAWEIVKEFVSVRMDVYTRRLQFQVAVHEVELKRTRARLQFLKAWISGELDFKAHTQEENLQLMDAAGVYPPEQDVQPPVPPAEAKFRALLPPVTFLRQNRYNYILQGLGPLSQSTDQVEKLEKRVQALEQQLHELQAMQPAQLWMQELDSFEQNLQAYIQDKHARHNVDASGAPILMPAVETTAPKKRRQTRVLSTGRNKRMKT